MMKRLIIRPQEYLADIKKDLDTVALAIAKGGVTWSDDERKAYERARQNIECLAMQLKSLAEGIKKLESIISGEFIEIASWDATPADFNIQPEGTGQIKVKQGN